MWIAPIAESWGTGQDCIRPYSRNSVVPTQMKTWWYIVTEPWRLVLANFVLLWVVTCSSFWPFFGYTVLYDAQAVGRRDGTVLPMGLLIGTERMECETRIRAFVAVRIPQILSKGMLYCPQSGFLVIRRLSSWKCFSSFGSGSIQVATCGRGVGTNTALIAH